MTEVSRPRCICSTIDYCSPAWSADYFPEACPEEWKLAYYMNDFQGVYLPAERWSGEGQLALISAELEGDFSLVLEWPAAISMSDARALLDELNSISEHVASLVVKLDAAGMDSYLPLLRMLRAHYPVSLRIKRGFDPAQSALLEQLGIGLTWMPVRPVEPLLVDAYLVVIVPVMALREIRGVLESLAGVIDRGVEVGLFIEEEPGAPQRAKEVRTLLELLELA